MIILNHRMVFKLMNLLYNMNIPIISTEQLIEKLRSGGTEVLKCPGCERESVILDDRNSNSYCLFGDYRSTVGANNLDNVEYTRAINKSLLQDINTITSENLESIDRVTASYYYYTILKWKRLFKLGFYQWRLSRLRWWYLDKKGLVKHVEIEDVKFPTMD